MAQLFLSRDTKVFLRIGSNAWAIPVLDGFSFSQATASSEVTLAEMEGSDGVSRRGKKVFNDALSPGEWSFTTYVRPFASAGVGEGAADTVAGNIHAVDEALWAIMAGPAYYENSTFKDGAGGNAYFTQGTDSLLIDFTESNASTLGEGLAAPSLVFKVGEDGNHKLYELSGVVVNEATINFDIDGIASIDWSGMGSILTEISDTDFDYTDAGIIDEATLSTGNFIRNRLTQLTVQPNMSNPIYTTANVSSTGYDITLTGGSITISNNISFITPEELGIVNYPIGHVTGNRSVSGTFTAYLVDDATADQSSDFWEDMANLTDVVTHDFDITFAVGGSAGSIPGVVFNFPKAHVEIPTHSIEDVIALETNFTGLGTSLDTADEVTITYYGETQT